MEAQKKRGVKSCLWMKAVDSQLRFSSHHELSLEALQQPVAEADRKSPFEWMGMSCSLDQGPDGVCAVNWLMRKALCNIDPCWDISHIIGNAWKAGLSQAGLMRSTG